MTHTHHSHTPEQNLAARMAHVARMSALVDDITEEGTQGRAELMAHVENLKKEVIAVYAAEKADAIRTARAYSNPASIQPVPEDGPIYQKSPLSTHMALSDNGPDTRTVHPSWEDRLPEMEDGFSVERLPVAQPGFFKRAANFVKGLFA